MNMLIESMTKLELSDYIIRLWVQEATIDDFDKIDHDFIRFTMKKICDKYHDNVAYLAKEILDIVPEINAVEVIKKNGDGVVLYKDWP